MPTRLGRRTNRIRFARGERILTIRLSIHHPSPSAEEDFYNVLSLQGDDRSNQGPTLERLREQINSYVEQELGEGFQIAHITVGRGSVEILVAIAAITEIVANWDEFATNVERLLSRLRALFWSRRFFPLPGPVWVEADWRPDFDVGRLLSGRGWDSVEIPIPVAVYVLATNLAMLGLLIWLVVVDH
jgi:hypothetical protein